MADEKEQDRERTRRSLTFYLAILFAAALVLLLFAYLMQSRSSEATIDSLRESVSSLQNVQDLYNSALELQDEIDVLEGQITQQADDLESLQQQLTQLQDQLAETQDALTQEQLTAQALELLWQLERAYNEADTALAQELAADLQQDDLLTALPNQAPEGGGPSPYQRCLELLEALAEE